LTSRSAHPITPNPTLSLIFLLAGSIQVVLMPLIGKFAPRADGRLLLAFGITVSSISLWMNGHLTSEASFMDLARPQMVRAVGMGFIFIPLSVIALSDLPASQRGNATGLFNLTRELGGSIGTAWMGLLIDRATTKHTVYLSEYVTPYNPLVQEQYGAIQGSLATQTATPQMVPEAVLSMKVKLQALVLSFQDGFMSATAVFLCALLLVLLLKKPKSAAGAAGAH